MTMDRPTTLPPRWAESLLRMFLAPHDRDSVSGDLLEEYRESILAERGAGANRWYARQVGWYVPRATGPWAALVGGILVGRYLLDTLAPVHYIRGVAHPRATIMSWMLIAIYALSGCWQAWRTGQWRCGVVAAFLTAAHSAAWERCCASPCGTTRRPGARFRAAAGSMKRSGACH